jgi:hypothetical protein
MDEPQFWQKAFSSRTAAPHFGQLTMSLNHRRATRNALARACRPAGNL